MFSFDYNNQNNRLVLWLELMCLAIICMIFIGGLTRLTHSGLSITQWKPVTGIIPPLNEQAWILEFARYKQSPEFIKINHHMDLSEFKSIFWVEFIHRLAGRITGLLYLFPFILFLLKGTIRGKDILIYVAGFILLVGQGFAGWYMVKSGLLLNPYVSHFRLAIHLLLAVLFYSLLFWQLLKNLYIAGRGNESLPQGKNEMLKMQKIGLMLNQWLNISLLLLFVQIILGAFVAGLNAGLIYNSFPLMGESFIPSEITLDTVTLNSFSDPIFVQFIHRIMAYILTIMVSITWILGLKIKKTQLSKALICLLLATSIQVMLGIITLIYSVPLIIALLHQLGAVLVLSCLLWLKYLTLSFCKTI